MAGGNYWINLLKIYVGESVCQLQGLIIALSIQTVRPV